MAISDGAFRLWHVLNGMAGQKGYCWPGQRGLAENYHWSIHSLKKWTTQLVDGGYLRVEKFDRRKHPAVNPRHNGVVYILSSAVAETGHSTVAQTGHSTVSQIASRVCPKLATGAVSQTGHVINQSELTKENQSKSDSERPSLKEIESNFLEDKSTIEEAKRFYDHYEREGWKTKDGTQIRSWRSVAAACRKNGLGAKPANNGNAPDHAGNSAISDDTTFRVEENGRLYEFNENHPPPAGTSALLYFENWKNNPDRKKA